MTWWLLVMNIKTSNNKEDNVHPTSTIQEEKGSSDTGFSYAIQIYILGLFHFNYSYFPQMCVCVFSFMSVYKMSYYSR